jgi:hypothetical protein
MAAPTPKADALRAMREANFEARKSRPEVIYKKAVNTLKKSAAKKGKKK